MLVRAAVFGEVGGEGDLRVAFADARDVLVHGQAQPLRFARPLGDGGNIEQRLLRGHGGADDVVNLLQRIGGVTRTHQLFGVFRLPLPCVEGLAAVGIGLG